MLLPLGQKKRSSPERWSTKIKELWQIWSDSRTHTTAVHWRRFLFPFSQQNTWFYYVLFLLFSPSSARSDWQILRKPHNFIIMLTFPFIIFLCFPPQLLAFWGRKYDFCFILYFCLGSLWDAGCVCLVWNSTVARRKYTVRGKNSRYTQLQSFFFPKREWTWYHQRHQNISICVFYKYSVSTKSMMSLCLLDHYGGGNHRQKVTLTNVQHL